MAETRIQEHPEYVEAVGYLRNWQNGGWSFSAQFFNLLAKADHGNRQNLRDGFPYWVAAWEDWVAAPTSDEFFQQFFGR